MKKGPLADAIALLRARDWEGAHVIVQDRSTHDNKETHASWAHGIVHLIEGDESNARYWYSAAGRPFPGMTAIDAEIEALQAMLGPTAV